VRRLLLGWRYAARRRRLYEALARRWEATTPQHPTVLGAARGHAPELDRRTLLEQIPHWMFTFTRSGTDLLTRSLALASSRAEARERIREECAAAGPLDRAETVGRLDFTRACILETGRLFPPVTRTFHHGVAEGGREVVHWFPLLQRDDALGASVQSFRPERWLADPPDAAAEASNLFLRGPRACPGSDLILFVCMAALARQIGELGITGGGTRLARDPLPVSFPADEARFMAPEAGS
jgi:cytochrome P450